MFKQLQSRARSLAIATLALGTAAANAAVDTTVIEGASDDILLVGVAVLGVAVSIKLYKWVRAAL